MSEYSSELPSWWWVDVERLWMSSATCSGVRAKPRRLLHVRVEFGSQSRRLISRPIAFNCSNNSARPLLSEAICDKASESSDNPLLLDDGAAAAAAALFDTSEEPCFRRSSSRPVLLSSTSICACFHPSQNWIISRQQ